MVREEKCNEEEEEEEVRAERDEINCAQNAGENLVNK